MTAEQNWQQLTNDLRERGLSWYAIAKECCDFDGNKVKRWASGRSIPNGNEAPKLERMHARFVSHETSDAT